MMLMGLFPVFWLAFEGQPVLRAGFSVQKLTINHQAAKRAETADGHAGLQLDSELLPQETSTGFEALVLQPSFHDAMRFFYGSSTCGSPLGSAHAHKLNARTDLTNTETQKHTTHRGR